jgi:predicted Zn-dependent protease
MSTRFAARAGTIGLGSALVLALGIATVHGSGSANREPATKTPAADNQTEAQSPYDQAMDLVKSEQYEDARKIFEDLAAKTPDNPDVVNMLAYTQRKTGDLDEALRNYQRALKLRPKFPEAHEYLGEAYLQAAMREMDTLRGFGGSGKDEVQKLNDAFQAAAAQLDPNQSGGGKAKSSKW